jgi:hypothetical protein
MLDVSNTLFARYMPYVFLERLPQSVACMVPCTMVKWLDPECGHEVDYNPCAACVGPVQANVYWRRTLLDVLVK